MPVLENARYEKFAQAVANGKNGKNAFAEAGYKPSPAGPTRLKKLVEVSNRIAELLEERARLVIAKVGVEIEYTRENLLRELEEARQIALSDMNGSAMSMATLGKAKILGLIIDRREVGDVGAFDAMTDAELMERAVKKAEELGVPGPPRLVVDNDEDDEKSGVG